MAGNLKSCVGRSSRLVAFPVLPPSASKSLLHVIPGPGPTLYLPGAGALASTFHSHSEFLPENRMVGRGRREDEGEMELCPFQHQIFFAYNLSLEGMERFPAPLPVSGFALTREVSRK